MEAARLERAAAESVAAADDEWVSTPTSLVGADGETIRAFLEQRARDATGRGLAYLGQPFRRGILTPLVAQTSPGAAERKRYDALALIVYEATVEGAKRRALAEALGRDEESVRPLIARGRALAESGVPVPRLVQRRQDDSRLEAFLGSEPRPDRRFSLADARRETGVSLESLRAAIESKRLLASWSRGISRGLGRKGTGTGWVILERNLRSWLSSLELCRYPGCERLGVGPTGCCSGPHALAVQTAGKPRPAAVRENIRAGIRAAPPLSKRGCVQAISISKRRFFVTAAGEELRRRMSDALETAERQCAAQLSRWGEKKGRRRYIGRFKLEEVRDQGRHHKGARAALELGRRAIELVRESDKTRPRLTLEPNGREAPLEREDRREIVEKLMREFVHEEAVEFPNGSNGSERMRRKTTDREYHKAYKTVMRRLERASKDMPHAAELRRLL